MLEFCERHNIAKIETSLFPICILCWLQEHLARMLIHDLFQVNSHWFELIFLPRFSPLGHALPELWAQLLFPGGKTLDQADCALPYVEDSQLLFGRGNAAPSLIVCRLRKGAYIQPVTVLLNAEQANSAVRCCFDNNIVPD
jgi:hypothetical protein